MGRTKLLAIPIGLEIVLSTLSLSTSRQQGDLIVSAAGELHSEGQELIVVRPPADVERWLWTHRDGHVRVVHDLAGVIGLPQAQQRAKVEL